MCNNTFLGMINNNSNSWIKNKVNSTFFIIILKPKYLVNFDIMVYT